MTSEERKAQKRKDMWKFVAFIGVCILAYFIGEALGTKDSYVLTKGDLWGALVAVLYILYRLDKLTEKIQDLQSTADNIEDALTPPRR
jgi:hypothetical protein